MNKKFQISAKITSPEDAEMSLEGVVGDWWEGNTSKQIRSQIQAFENAGIKNLTLLINSEGGDVFEGLAIFNSLERSPLNVNTVNMALAASMGSILLMAGTERAMYYNAQMMIHSASTYAYGNKDDFREVADLLENIDENSMAAIYKAKSNMDDAKIKELMSKDSWIGATEALALGLITKIIPANTPAKEEETEAVSEKQMKTDKFKNHINQKLKGNMSILKSIASIFSAGTEDEAKVQAEAVKSEVSAVETELATLRAELAKEKAKAEADATAKAEIEKTKTEAEANAKAEIEKVKAELEALKAEDAGGKDANEFIKGEGDLSRISFEKEKTELFSSFEKSSWMTEAKNDLFIN